MTTKADLGQPPDPTPEALFEARNWMALQLDSKTYCGAAAPPDGSPQLPPGFATTHRLLLKEDGAWCLLPKTENEIPASWYANPGTQSPNQS